MAVEVIEGDIEQRLAYDGGDDSLHQKLLTKLNEMRRLSDQFLSERKPVWSEVDRTQRGFVDLKAMAKLADGSRSSSELEMPVERAIVVPATAAMLDVRRSQFVSAFTARTPITQLKPTDGATVKSAHAMEMNLDYDYRACRHLVGLNTFLRDADRYGQGWFYSGWKREYGNKIINPVFKDEEGFVQYMIEQGYPPDAAAAFFPIAEQSKPQLFQPQREYGLKREFNNISCIDPTLMITDPRAKGWDPNAYEYCGHTEYVPWTEVWDQRRQGDRGLFFNLDAAKRLAVAGANQGEGGGATDKPIDRQHTRLFAGDTGTLKLDWITWRCIPRDHELSPSEDVILWQFVICNEAVIIGAWELDHDHGRIPYVRGESQPDQHTVWNPGSAELADGIQRIIDFNYAIYTEHMRKALHSAGLVHEDLVEMRDILFPTPGGHIRVSDEVAKRVLEGRMKLGDAFQELVWPDFTRGYLESNQWIYEFAMRLLAANDPAQGMPTEDKRTLGEVQAIMANSSARVAVSARIIDEQAIMPLVEMCVANLRQYLTMSRYVHVLGSYQKEFGSEIAEIRPSDIWGNYGYIPIDGTQPPDPSRQAESVERMIALVGQMPVLNGGQPTADGQMLQFNYPEAVKMWGYSMGFHNIDSLLEIVGQIGPALGAPPRVEGAEQVAAQVQAGNYVPPEALAAGG